ncbi:MAG: hypothetical protein KDC48_00005, partial [Planctomycetes bacterium]|nr:hypothetical protein [Planctomycetota bacterium]
APACRACCGEASAAPFFFDDPERTQSYALSLPAALPTWFELWVTDGTAVGTHQFADLRPGSASSYPSHLARIGDEIYFSADTGGGQEPWVTDGTVTGTRSLGDLRPGANGSTPMHFAGYPGNVVFQATDGVTGYELFHTDGTAAGTGLLLAINPGSSSWPEEMFAFDGRVFFFATDALHGRELWRTDFTAAGTVMVQDLAPGAYWSNPSNLVGGWRDQNFLFVAYQPGHGTDVFACDGTTLSYAWPPGINMPSAMTTTSPQDLRMIGSRKLYFDGSTPGHGHQLHVVDMTRPNPFGLYVYDLNPSGYSDPQEFVALRDLVLFTARDAAGRELWVMPNGATEEPADRGCSGSRLDVQDPVLGQDIYYYITTDVPNAAPMTMIGWPAQTPFVLPWVSACPVHVDPGLTAFVQYPAGWNSGTQTVPNDIALQGLELVMQCFVGSTTTPSLFDFTNAVHLYLGL